RERGTGRRQVRAGRLQFLHSVRSHERSAHAQRLKVLDLTERGQPDVGERGVVEPQIFEPWQLGRGTGYVVTDPATVECEALQLAQSDKLLDPGTGHSALVNSQPGQVLETRDGGGTRVRYTPPVDQVQLLQVR